MLIIMRRREYYFISYNEEKSRHEKFKSAANN